MPTFNQLVHTGREVVEKKAKAPALLEGLELQEARCDQSEFSAEARRVHSLLRPLTPKKPNSALRKIARVRLSNGHRG